MANFRQIHVGIWHDPWFLNLEPDEKLVFIYLFSNPRTNLAGLYEIPLKVISFDTGLTSDQVKTIIDSFIEDGKIMYQDNVIWVRNMTKYHESRSDRVQTGIINAVKMIPDCEVKRQYQYHIDTLSIPYTDGIDTSPYKDKDKELNKKIDKEKENNNNLKNLGESFVGDAFALYEQEVGVLTAIIRDQILDTWVDIPVQDKMLWFIAAVKIAVNRNARNWAYISKVLNNWIAQGSMTTNVPKAKDTDVDSTIRMIEEMS